MITPTAAYARDVSVTWWYTASSILFLHAFAAVTWTIGVFAEGAPTALVLNLLGVAGSLASAVLLLVRYRREPLDDADATARRRCGRSSCRGSWQPRRWGCRPGRSCSAWGSPRRPCAWCGGARACGCAWPCCRSW
ncbi:hypothetical protein [Microbacterium sp. IEGM 1404]|uniref:hypothetical protein n=1 Tax=Microbacterium sp. IEGM 1404 TaxID=3047084 RepID=UPI0024B6D4D0|nr:hypothetical protein [Microbacterium sp. IEGM 1404]MDI9891963.1 hypothetical protein [Microbacterium sp. IEGM 1404]